MRQYLLPIEEFLDRLMYSNGRIYVVVAVIAIIFLGLALYLVQLDRKITKLENEK